MIKNIGGSAVIRAATASAPPPICFQLSYTIDSINPDKYEALRQQMFIVGKELFTKQSCWGNTKKYFKNRY